MAQVQGEGLGSRLLKSVAIAAILALSGSYATNAIAASPSAPGETTGLALFSPLTPGVYMTNFISGGSRSTAPNTVFDFYNPFIYWQTPWQIAGVHIAFYVGDSVVNTQAGPTNVTGIFNPIFGTSFVYKLTKDVGVGFGVAGYPPLHSATGFNFGTIETRSGVSYTGNDSDLTANFIHGISMKNRSTGMYDIPDYLIVDLTATKHFGKWEAGFIGYGSTDLSQPFAGYKRLNQFAVGGLVGYAFEHVIVQLKGSVDVHQRNYGGYDRRLWTNVIFPLYSEKAPAPTEAALKKRY